MKRSILSMMVALATFAVIACDPIENQDDKNEPNEPNDPNEPPVETVDPLQPSEQKEKLAIVGQKLMDKMPASDWESYSALVDDFANSVYASEDYDWGTLEEWFGEEYSEAFYAEENEVIDGEKHITEWTIDIAILMSNHTGLFTCTEDGIEFSEYDGGTKAILYLNGNTYEAEIVSSGEITEAKYAYSSGEYNQVVYPGECDPETGEILEDPYYGAEVDKVSITVGVPERIDISITENGSPLATVSLMFTPSFSSEDVDITTDSFSVQTTVSINGFEVVSEKVAYDGAKGKASLQAEISKNGENLISTSASADAELAIEEDDYFYDYVVVTKAKNIDLSLNILDEIQVKGTCSNAVEAYESLDLMWDALYRYDTADMTEAKRHLDNINAKINLNVYYDGTDVKQATVAFDLESYKDDYSGYENYNLIPIIIFEDGSRYKIEEFFTESAFGELIDSFQEFCSSFEELVGFES